MSSIDSSMTVGVFREEAQAQQALASLQGAGFQQVQFFQPGRAAPQSGGLFAGIKRLLAGDNESIAGKLSATGVSEVDARYYQQEYAAGRIILAVRANERKQEALDILRDHGAYDAYTRNRKTTETSETSEAVLASETGSTPEAPTTLEVGSTSEVAPTDKQGTQADALSKPANEGQVEVDDQQELDLKREQLNVSREPAQAEEVELHKAVSAEQKASDVPYEEAVVEKTISIHAVDTGDDDTKVPGKQVEEVRIPVQEERVEVAKAPIVTSEVSDEKPPVREAPQVTDTMEREELPVKPTGDVSISGTPGTSNDRSPQGKRRQNSVSKPHAKSRKRH